MFVSLLWLSGLLVLYNSGCLADVFEECNESNNGFYIASPKSCAHYIACEGEDSFEGECGEGDYFNAEDQVCELMLDVDCRTGLSLQTNGEESALAPGPAPISIPSPALEITELNMTETQEQNATVVTSSVAPPSAANASSSANVSLSAITPASSPSASTSSSSILSTGLPSIIVVSTVCPPQDNLNRIVLLSNPNSCTDYFICYHGKAQAMSCSPQLHFNPSTGKCDRPENAKCLTTNISVREQCKAHIVDVYPHSDNCNYFYYCNMGFLMVQQCPLSFGWDYEKRSCMALSQANCYKRKSSI